MRTMALLTVICLSAATASAKYGGGTGEPNDPYLIFTAEHLRTIGRSPGDWDKNFRLMADIDLGKSLKTNFGRIGMDIDRPFRGTFDGNGHTISNMTYVTVQGEENNIGLFGYGYRSSHEAIIKNLGLIDPNIDAVSHGRGDYVGSLVGSLFAGTIINCYVRGGTIAGRNCVGGLVGGHQMTQMYVILALDNCYATDCVRGTQEVGGLMGLNDGKISHCYTTGSVSGQKEVGGLVGYNRGSEAPAISTCYSTGRVRGISQVGGLVGYAEFGEIANCYSISKVTGDTAVGGLAGVLISTVRSCYFAGVIEGAVDAGGLVGTPVDLKVRRDGTPVTGTAIDSFWDVEMSGQTISAAGAGKTTAQMKQKSTFAAWDFTETWDIAERQTYPFLRFHPGN